MTLEKTGPWPVFISVGDISADGTERMLQADAQARTRIAQAIDVPNIFSLAARFHLTPRAGGRIEVEGRVTGELEQACVVTLEPLRARIDESFLVTFVPGLKVEPLPDGELDDDALAHLVSEPDEEPLINESIDLGRLAVEFFALGIDPYPRKEGAVFTAPKDAADPADHPFAGLEALKKQSKMPPEGN